ncbi:MAG: hypothetical protein JKY09_05075 [Crocinitomicaceae bacterium]|nr:hypothetical protein [Crocinitomicaceae bacterium]
MTTKIHIPSDILVRLGHGVEHGEKYSDRIVGGTGFSCPKCDTITPISGPIHNCSFQQANSSLDAIKKYPSNWENDYADFSCRECKSPFRVAFERFEFHMSSYHYTATEVVA